MASISTIKFGTVSQSTLNKLRGGSTTKGGSASNSVRKCNICGGTGIHPSTKAGPKQKK